MGQKRQAAIGIRRTFPTQCVELRDIGHGDVRNLLSAQDRQDMQLEIAPVFGDRSRLFVLEGVALQIDFGELLQGRRAERSRLGIGPAAMVRQIRKVLSGFRAGRLGCPERAVAPDGQKMLAASPVAILQDVDGRMALAADAEPFDVRIPDCLARCQLGYRFE